MAPTIAETASAKPAYGAPERRSLVNFESWLDTLHRYAAKDIQAFSTEPGSADFIFNNIFFHVVDMKDHPGSHLMYALVDELPSRSIETLMRQLLEMQLKMSSRNSPYFGIEPNSNVLVVTQTVDRTNRVEDAFAMLNELSELALSTRNQLDNLQH